MEKNLSNLFFKIKDKWLSVLLFYAECSIGQDSFKKELEYI